MGIYLSHQTITNRMKTNLYILLILLLSISFANAQSNSEVVETELTKSISVSNTDIQINTTVKTNVETTNNNEPLFINVKDLKETIARTSDIRTYFNRFRNLDNKETNSAIYASIGYVSGFIIYIVILLYGMGVMRGVMEEKTNRIAEVMISSVSPFQLMMGKIIGIGFVGLTQFLLWLLLGGILNLFLPFFIPGFSESMMQNIPANEMAKLPKTNSNEIIVTTKNNIYVVDGVYSLIAHITNIPGYSANFTSATVVQNQISADSVPTQT